MLGLHHFGCRDLHRRIHVSALAHPFVVVRFAQVAHPRVGSSATRKSPGPRFFASRKAPDRHPPPEPPVNSPSNLASRRATTKHSSSFTWIMSSRIFKFIVVGKKSSPMPSTT